MVCHFSGKVGQLPVSSPSAKNGILCEAPAAGTSLPRKSPLFEKDASREGAASFQEEIVASFAERRGCSQLCTSSLFEWKIRSGDRARFTEMIHSLVQKLPNAVCRMFPQGETKKYGSKK